MLDTFSESENPENWRQLSVCPIHHYGNPKQAAQQMRCVLNQFSVEIFITTGGDHFRIGNDFRKIVQPLQDRIENDQLIIASIDTTPAQVAF